MKVLVLHNEYQQYGGEDSVVKNEVELLKNAGHNVYLEIISNHQIKDPFSKFMAALGLIFSFKSFFYIKKLIKKVKPDVVHVHNFFPLWSPSIFYACRSLKIPVVLTLHNYRTLCPTALLMYDGKVTEKSISDGPWWAVPKKVYRNSLFGTLLLALMISIHKWLGTWEKQVTTFIVLTQFAREKFSNAGFPSNKIEIKPNFVNIDIPLNCTKRDSTFLYVGRLSEEKGIYTLSNIPEESLSGFSVKIIGNGSLDSALAHSSFRKMGHQNSQFVFQCMQKHLALVLPSICYEGFPMTIVEAYANGLPVIGSRIGSIGELVEHGVTGLLFEPGNSENLAQTMQWALEHPDEMYQMGLNARKRYEDLYTAHKNIQQLESIYQNAIQSSKNERLI